MIWFLNSQVLGYYVERVFTRIMDDRFPKVAVNLITYKQNITYISWLHKMKIKLLNFDGAILINFHMKCSRVGMPLVHSSN